MHTPISESDITSNAPSFSPKPYYVESPSPDDTTEDKCSTNCQSPSDSPFFPSSASSASTAASRVSGNRRRWNKQYYNAVDAAEQGGDYDVEHTNLSRPLSFLFAFGLAFAALCLTLWVASRPAEEEWKGYVDEAGGERHSIVWEWGGAGGQREW